mgnify:CR=1 FL=1
MAFDVSTDHLVFDGPEAATIIGVTDSSVGAGGKKSETTVEIALSAVLRRTLSHQEQVQYGGGLGVVDTKWEVPVVDLVYNAAPYQVKVEDRIRDAQGGMHHIQSFETTTIRTRLRVLTRKA